MRLKNVTRHKETGFFANFKGNRGGLKVTKELVSEGKLKSWLFAVSTVRAAKTLNCIIENYYGNGV